MLDIVRCSFNLDKIEDEEALVHLVQLTHHKNTNDDDDDDDGDDDNEDDYDDDDDGLVLKERSI